MERTPKNEPRDAVSVNEIYEKLNDHNFTEELWLDVISDIGNKPSYKRLKEMITCFIEDSLADFDTIPVDKNVAAQRHAAFTEMSIMAYTVDSVISAKLHRRLQAEIKSTIGKALEKRKTEKEAKKNKIPSKSRNGNKTPIKPQNKNKCPTRPENKKKTPTNPHSVPINVESVSTSKKKECNLNGSVGYNQENTINLPVRKRGRPRKGTSKTELEKRSEKLDSSDSSSSKDSSGMSSCSDSVEICTDNKGTRKEKLSIKALKDMIDQGTLPKFYMEEVTTYVAKQRRNLTSNKKHSNNVAVRPQRKRKPNSKYNSTTMLLDTQDYSSQSDSFTSSVRSEEIESEPEIEPPPKRASRLSGAEKDFLISIKPKRPVRKPLQSESDTAAEILSPVSSSTPFKNTAKRYDSTDLYKPRLSFGSPRNSRKIP